MKVVIADDNRELCEEVSCALSGKGHEVDSVNNGYELLAYLEKNNPSVIILDLRMRGKDGTSIFDSVRSISPQSRIIVYTGYSEYSGSVYARKADHFLIKGGDIANLITAVDEAA